MATLRSFDLYKLRQIYHTEFSLFQNAVQVHTDETEKTSALNFIKQAFKLYKHMYKIMSLSG